MATLAVRAQAIVALSACAFLTAACDVGADAQGFTTRDEKQFTVSGTPDVTLATFDGSIEIRSWDRPEVQVVIERRAETTDEVDSIEIKAEQAGNQISIEARRPAGRQHRIVFGYHVGRSAKLIASVPRLTNVLARSGDGAIRIRARSGSAMTDNWDVTTGDGSIEIELPDRFSADLDAHTGDGRIDVSALSLTLGEKARHTVRGRLGEGGKKLRLRSGDGGIRVRGALLAERTYQK